MTTPPGGRGDAPCARGISPDPIVTDTPLVQELEKKMQRLVPPEAEPWFSADDIVDHGDPAETILPEGGER